MASLIAESWNPLMAELRNLSNLQHLWNPVANESGDRRWIDCFLYPSVAWNPGQL